MNVSPEVDAVFRRALLRSGKLIHKGKFMSKTTPEEARQLATKHLGEFWSGRQMMQLAALIDEVRSEKALEYVTLFGELQNALEEIERLRGVDAEPFMHVYEFASPFGGTVWRDSPDMWNGNKPKRSQPLYTHPAPSQPAAPVELPVVGDTELLNFMANSQARYLEMHCGMWRVYQDHALPHEPNQRWIAMSTPYAATPREAIRAAIAAGRKA